MPFRIRRSDGSVVPRAPAIGRPAAEDEPPPPPDPERLQAMRPLVEAERARLLHGPVPGARPTGFLVRFSAPCSGDPRDVLAKARAVLAAVDEATLSGWPPDHEWASRLPAWFVAECAPEQSREAAEREMEAHRALPWKDQALLAQTEKWSLLNWVFWFRPEERAWYWWDSAAPPDNRKVVVEVVAEGSPIASGALDWLLRASGSGPIDESE